jgi:transcriptional regulator with XRE-family HTH domain
MNAMTRPKPRPSPAPAGFGAKLRKLRKAKDWSQDRLAEEVGIHGRHVGKYEIGRAMPNAQTVVRIADALGVTTDYLLRDGVGDDSVARTSGLEGEILEKFRAVAGMGDEDKRVVLSLIDAYIKKRQIEKVLQG